MTDFPPPRRGLTLQVSMIIIATVLVVVFAILASQEPIGLRFTIYILAAALVFFPLPFLAYWLYSLFRANYSLDREKLTLTWGLRVEEIPVSEVEWVRPVETQASPLALPLIHFPGAITGFRRHPDLGPVEFLASDARALLLVATSKRVFAISPQDPAGFMQNIQRAIELGSLSPASPQSVYPTFVVLQAWESMLVRYLWLAGLFLNIGLLAWVTLLIPSLGHIPLGFLPSGAVGEPVPGAGLILLPGVSLFFNIIGWVAGMFFYRRPNRRPLAHIVWASGVFSTFLFLVAVMFIVTTPV
ncbi:MAG TPA: PH domain-containing protein [Anaerolineales bacterium]